MATLPAQSLSQDQKGNSFSAVQIDAVLLRQECNPQLALSFPIPNDNSVAERALSYQLLIVDYLDSVINQHATPNQVPYFSSVFEMF
jgi:hypothetical protein